MANAEKYPALRRFLRPAFVRFFARAVGVTLVVTWAAFLLNRGAVSEGPTRIGGDFTAFYGAGRIIAAGQGQNLYSQTTQASFQRDLLPDCPGCALMFAYPAPVAVVYGAFSLLPFRAAYALQTLLMILGLWVAMRLLRPLYEATELDPLTVTCFMLACPPVFTAAFMGQNSMVTVLVFAGLYAALRKGDDVLTGLALTALFFKPQYAAPVALCLLADRRWRALFVAAAGGLMLYASAIPFCGLEWGVSWFRYALQFRDIDAVLNGMRGVSLVSYVEGALPSLRPLALAISGVVFAALLWLWFRRYAKAEVLLAITATVAVFTAPHAMIYDVALAAPTALWLAPKSPRVAAAAFAMAAASAYVNGCGVTALALLLVASVMQLRADRVTA